MFALIHSPLTGPSAWEPVAESLRRRGHRVAVPALAEAFEAGPPYYAAVAASIGRQIAEAGPDAAVTLVAHSGAGALLPAIAEATPGVDGAVFVDALLPHPGVGWFATVPPPMRERLLGLADGDRLRKWSDWFPPGTMEELLPDPDRRRRFIGELPYAPLAYFEEAAPDPASWPPRRCAYLRLSEAYGEQEAEAARLGWTVRRLDGDHLSIATRAEAVAPLLEDLGRTGATDSVG
ncbi:alpha/beta hydrolase [Glycomyces tarimensis]